MGGLMSKLYPRAAGLFILLLTLVALAPGCSRSTLRPEDQPTSRRIDEIGQGQFKASVEAFVVPPDDWTLEPPKTSDQHTHLVWLSPTGDTAYGAIYLELPGWAPVFLLSAKSVHNRVLDGVMDAMAADQGEATLLEKEWDGSSERMYYKAEGGLYLIDAVLSVRGHSGWTVYAGKLRERPLNEAEMKTALAARDATQVGREAAEMGED